MPHEPSPSNAVSPGARGATHPTLLLLWLLEGHHHQAPGRDVIPSTQAQPLTSPIPGDHLRHRLRMELLGQRPATSPCHLPPDPALLMLTHYRCPCLVKSHKKRVKIQIGNTFSPRWPQGWPCHCVRSQPALSPAQPPGEGAAKPAPPDGPCEAVNFPAT